MVLSVLSGSKDYLAKVIACCWYIADYIVLLFRITYCSKIGQLRENVFASSKSV